MNPPTCFKPLFDVSTSLASTNQIAARSSGNVQWFWLKKVTGSSCPPPPPPRLDSGAMSILTYEVQSASSSVLVALKSSNLNKMKRTFCSYCEMEKVQMKNRLQSPGKYSALETD